MGKEDSPLVANEFVEVDRAVGGVGIEIRGSRAQTKANGQSVQSIEHWSYRTYGGARSAIVNR